MKREPEPDKEARVVIAAWLRQRYASESSSLGAADDLINTLEREHYHVVTPMGVDGG